MKAITVARVSTEEQREANNSLPAQTHRMEEYCRRNGFDIIESFSFDESAYTDNRTEFDSILSRIDSQNEKIIVCFDKVDRFSRDIFDKRVPILYNKALAGLIELHFVSDGQVIDNKMSAGNKFMFGVKLGLSNYYSDAISDNVIRAFSEKRRNGEWLGVAPLGYLNVTLENGTKSIIPDPERAPIIAHMFEMYASGNYSMLSVTEWATKEANFRTKLGNKLSKGMIEHIIHNPFYCGIAYSRKYKTYTPHKYTQIISEELFRKCEEICGNRRAKPVKAIAREFIFKGICTCDKCGCLFTPEGHKKKSGIEFVYYSCTNGKHICKREYVPESVFIEPLGKILAMLANITPEVQEYLLNELKKDTEDKKSFEQHKIRSIRKDIEKNEQQMDGLVNTLALPSVSSITRDRCDKKIQSLNDESTLLKQKLANFSSSINNFEMGLNTIISLARRAEEIFESSEVDEKRMFINYLLQNSKVRDRKPLFNLRSPYNTLLKNAESQTWLPG